ncbi:hypothetical protein, partial [Acidocella sp. MX-AZ02]|uniref:hypothetical protein n=1 Tax=Acidocella sp. MX-AZ02 TaxID=1214225 RepID=UPI00196A030A
LVQLLVKFRFERGWIFDDVRVVGIVSSTMRTLLCSCSVYLETGLRQFPCVLAHTAMKYGPYHPTPSS